MQKIALPDPTILEIIDLYKSGKSCPKIGRQFGLSGEYIRCLLKDNHIVLRKYHEINRKHVVNERFFDCIDTQEKAYFLGFLFSDGNVHSKSNAITLKLHKKDEEILVKLSNMVLGKTLLHPSENNLALKFSSYHMKQRLIELGCMPNKSLKIVFPKIDERLHSHFIRGYFDGDGCIVRYENDFYASMISTESFCNSVWQIVFDAVGIDGNLSKSKQMLDRGNYITSIITYKGNRRAEKVLDWLYQDATIYLARKHQKYLELKEWIADVDSRLKGYGSRNRKNRHIPSPSEQYSGIT